ncbi:MAG: sodium ion-translocating decarboxylase subunit beta, partial [Candidatus Gastranaerophilales bacterium]|nr:sodium ion-translocating decarboxylase subunit beta [Candidatus Gastranaerophilales bacterium]
MQLIDGLTELWYSTGIYNFIKTAVEQVDGSVVDKFMFHYGQPIMIIICCFLLWLGIKKRFEPLLLVPIAFGGILSNIPMPLGEEIAGANGFLGIIFAAGI